jgi:Xaa-Pro aminopeptidase
MTEFAARRTAVIAQLEQRKLDAFLVSGAPNVRYLTGFTGSNAIALFAGGDATLFTDPRYAIQAAQETDCRVKVSRGLLLKDAIALLRRKRARRVGFEKSRLGFEGYDYLRTNAPLKTSLAAVAGLVERLRMTKSPAEIALIRRSVETNSRAFEQALKHIRAGMRESELAAEIDYRMRRLGAERPAFETIVAFGERTALPHASPGPRILERGQLILIDMGASQDGYASDMTRVLHFGRPQAQVKSLYRAVLEAQLAAIEAVRPGIAAQSVDRAARSVLRKHGLDRAFVHSTGHGLGLEIHEAPRLGKKDKTRLEAGMAITIEPGAYLEGTGGIRIEDTVVVTNTGCEVLTATPKELRPAVLT